MDATTYTVQEWRGGHANVGHTARATRIPLTKLAAVPAGPDRVSADGQYRYVRDGRRVAVQDVPTGEWLWDEQFDAMHLGWTSMTEARRFTAELDAQAAADAQGFEDGDPDCRCVRACGCTSYSTDPID